MLLAVLSFLLILVVAGKCNWKKRRLPNGPRGIPFLGNVIPLIRNPLYTQLGKWAQQYGKLFTIKLGNITAVVVSDAALLKQLFGNEAACGAMAKFVHSIILGGPYGITSSNGNHWKQQRIFMMRTMKKFGVGKVLTEKSLLENGQQLMSWFSEDPTRCKQVSFLNYVRTIVDNSLWNIITGEKLSVHDTSLSQIVHDLSGCAQKSAKRGLDIFPWLMYLCPEKVGYTQLKASSGRLHNLISEIIRKHQETRTDGLERDIIDAYLNENESTMDTSSSFYGEIGRKQIRAAIIEMFIAGSETTTNTVMWLILYLTHHQLIQRKVQDEIDNVLGDERPSILSRKRMPYIEAVMMEVLRISSMLQVGFPHQMVHDMEFHGYRLHKGLVILPNLYHIHHDPQVWNNPDEFQPERFLNSDASKLNPKAELLPFQTGKRECIGASMAKDTIFLLTTAIFQSLNVYPMEGMKLDFSPNEGLGLFPKPFDVRIEFRKSIQDRLQ